MIKKSTKLLLGLIFIVSTTLASAAQLNVTLGDDIVSNQDRIDLHYQICASDHFFCMSPSLKGISIGLFTTKMIPGINDSLVRYPSLNNELSYISLGYDKDGASISPDSCQNIKFNTTVTNIVMNEAGCTVS